MTVETPPRNGRRIEGLDAVRGLAVFLVMLRHMAPSLVGGGGVVGVTIFFALSGYLITGLLQRDLNRFGRVRWGRFYAHRAFRLYPALISLMVVFLLVELTAGLFGSKSNLIPSLVLGLSYTSDLPLPWRMSEGFTHLWTLSVEEQFYLLWPFLLFFAFRRGLSVKRVALAAAVLFTIACWVALYLAAAPEDLYERPWTWASSLAIGGVVRLYQDAILRLIGRRLKILAGAGIVLLLLLSALPELKEAPVTYLIGPTLIAAATVVVILQVKDWQTLPVKWLRPALWLGIISYGAYLWNLPVTQAYRAAFPDAPKLSMILTIPITIALAAASWWTVEALGRALRRRFDARVNLRDAVGGSRLAAND